MLAAFLTARSESGKMDTQIKVAQANAPQELKNVANWLRNKSGIKVKTGALGGKRADYFKGQ